jgi:hypothetical protein
LAWLGLTRCVFSFFFSLFPSFVLSDWAVPSLYPFRIVQISLVAYTSAPSRETMASLGKVASSPPQLFAEPGFYASQNLFGGRWTLPDGQLELEKKQDTLLTFYVNERDQRKWWGFWNAGDVMHTYDSVRHEWRYDIGGYAWDNAE